MSEIEIDLAIGEYMIPSVVDIVERYVQIFSEHFHKHYGGKGTVAQRAIHATSVQLIGFAGFPVRDGLGLTVSTPKTAYKVGGGWLYILISVSPI